MVNMVIEKTEEHYDAKAVLDWYASVCFSVLRLGSTTKIEQPTLCMKLRPIILAFSKYLYLTNHNLGYMQKHIVSM